MIEKNRTAKTKAKSFEKVDNFAEKQKINNKTESQPGPFLKFLL